MFPHFQIPTINSYYYLIEFTSETSGPDIFFVGTVLVADSVSLIVIGLLRFLHDLVVVGCMLVRMYPFLLGCPIYWHVIIYSSLFLLLLFSP